MAYILNMDNTHVITDLFGNDTQLLLEACEKAMNNWLYPYADCYSAIRKFRESSFWKGVGLCKAYKDFLDANPVESQKVEASRRKWEEQCAKQFRIIFGVAKRHGMYIHWHGNDLAACCGDRWTVYKKNQPIARIQC